MKQYFISFLTFIISLIYIHTIQAQVYGSITDPRDGQVYKTIKIGDQVWMVENLRFIPHVSPKKEQGGIWVYGYEGKDVSVAQASDNYKKYGCLYNWKTITNKEKAICPKGWHLPSKEEYETLLTNAGGVGVNIYRPLVKGGDSGFDAVFGGARNKESGLYGIGRDARIWSSTTYSPDQAYYLCFTSGNLSVRLDIGDMMAGFSVRCVQD